uniref:Uncharacterized protein n=1 Tax=Ananas comosus var. bracteatus TaxID=296719 RepID=A0A6V7P8B2_ANACO|nr:unnamed protein product [Ananas comosus var. bracteatus]
MSGGRGLRREMAGRPSEGGVSGAGEEPRAAPEGAVDLLAQARKALALRSPFDAEEAGPRAVTLPAGLAAFLAKHTDGRRKHKKPPEGSLARSPPRRPPWPPRPCGITPRSSSGRLRPRTSICWFRISRLVPVSWILAS